MIRRKITMPYTDEFTQLRAGDRVLITGILYTARDAAHKRFQHAIENGEPLPFSLQNQIIYYAGPTPAKPGKPIGSCGPTTSGRMDCYTPALLSHGLKGMIGKGPRSRETVEAMIRYQAVYFASVGGAAALIAKSVKSCEVIAYPELGPEAVHRLEVEDYPCVVAVDCLGNSLYSSATPTLSAP